MDSRIISHDVQIRKIDADAFVLSGGAQSISCKKDDNPILESVINLEIPILGICFGMQFIASYFDGVVGRAEVPEYGATQIHILKDDPLFDGMPRKFIAWENHNDEVKETSLEVIASSQTCKIQAIKHPDFPIYGVQFHPEVEHTNYGKKYLKTLLISQNILNDYEQNQTCKKSLFIYTNTRKTFTFKYLFAKRQTKHFD